MLLLAAAAAMGLVGAPAAQADPLNPLDFPSLGTVTLADAEYEIDSAIPRLTGPGTSLIGTISESGVAVFRFDDLTVSGGFVHVIQGRGARPVALLASGNLTFAALFYVAGGDGDYLSGLGGQSGAGGGGFGGCGSISFGCCNGLRGGGLGGGGPGGPDVGAVGGGHGGRGGGGSELRGGQPNGVQPNYQMAPLSGGSGGGGGSEVYGDGTRGGAGGGGGGAVELGALGMLTLEAGSIDASGGHGAGGTGGFCGRGGGGGSGGAVLLHGSTVTLGVVNAFGGPGGDGGPGDLNPSCVLTRHGGGGGGGRVALQATANPGSTGISVAGADPFGSEGVITFARPVLSPTNLDCGSVPVGSSVTLFMGIQNIGDAGSFINGRFPDASAPFARVGTGVFSGLAQNAHTAAPYTFTPTTTGPFSQELTFVSNAGPVTVTISGTGIDPGSDCLADFDNSGTLAVPDIFSFLSAWFAGCP